MQIINNLIEAAPVLIILYAGLLGLLAAGVLSIPVIKYAEKRGWIEV
jgi:hypothetical protein